MAAALGCLAAHVSSRARLRRYNSAKPDAAVNMTSASAAIAQLSGTLLADRGRVEHLQHLDFSRNGLNINSRPHCSTRPSSGRVLSLTGNDIFGELPWRRRTCAAYKINLCGLPLKQTSWPSTAGRRKDFTLSVLELDRDGRRWGKIDASLCLRPHMRRGHT